MNIFQPKTPIACIDAIQGEIWICEECYRKDVFAMLSASEKAEIHYEMGLELHSLSRPADSIRCLEAALIYRETADTHAALALSHDACGNISAAMGSYRRALEIDPTHFMSRENLKRLVLSQQEAE